MTNELEQQIKLIELENKYGKTQRSTGVLGLGEWNLNQEILFKDGKKRKLVYIKYRNMAVDLLRFDDGTELFTGDIQHNFDPTEFKQTKRMER